jgi:hypothetical protein
MNDPSQPEEEYMTIRAAEENISASENLNAILLVFPNFFPSVKHENQI